MVKVRPKPRPGEQGSSRSLRGPGWETRRSLLSPGKLPAAQRRASEQREGGASACVQTPVSSVSRGRPGPHRCSRLDGGPPAAARPHPLASLRSRPACPGDALWLSDEGQALCVFRSGSDRARVGVLAGAACQSHFQARPDASSPNEKGAASGRLWPAAFDPFPGRGAPRRGKPWGSGPLILARPAHCEFHGNPYTGLGFQG